jgi:hypothetical protein
MLLIGAGWSALAAFDVWLFLVRPDTGWDAKVGFVLGLVGVYTFAFGLLSATSLLDRIPIGADLTSPNPVRFIAGTATILALLQMAGALALTSKRTPESLDRRGGLLIGLVELPVVLLGFFVVVAFTIVYLVLVAPLAWLGYIAVSVPLDSILGAGGDMGFSMVHEGEESTVMVKKFVQENLVTLRNLLIAVPSLVSSLILSAPQFL